MHPVHATAFLKSNISDFQFKSQQRRSDLSPKENPQAIHMNLEKLFDLHDQLVELSEFSNDTYSMQIAAFITGAFVVILFGLFFELKVIKIKQTVFS